MKVLNLDKIVTRKDVVIVLDGAEHIMKSPTVKDYIDQIKKAEEITKLSEIESIESASKVLDLTIETLMKSFPTIKREQLENLSMEQLEAIRELVESSSNDDAPSEGDSEGEATGETE
jgi:hypothetical protein